MLLHLFVGLFMYNLVIHMVIGKSLPPPTVNVVIGLVRLQLLLLSFLGIRYPMMDRIELKMLLFLSVKSVFHWIDSEVFCFSGCSLEIS